MTKDAKVKEFRVPLKNKVEELVNLKKEKEKEKPPAPKATTNKSPQPILTNVYKAQ